MSDDSMVKIMQSLGLDYNPAINSTVQFQKTVGKLDKQLADMKATAMQTANDINNIFSSQLGKVDTNTFREFNKMFSDIEKQNKPIEIKVETDKAEIAMQEFAKNMGIKLDKNLREQFKGFVPDLSLGKLDQTKFDELATNITNSYKIAMEKQDKKLQISLLGDSDDKAIYDYLNGSTLRLSESTLNAKKNVDGFNGAIRNLVKTSSDSGHSLDQMAQELEGMGIQGFGANTEDIAERMTKAVQTVRNGFVNLGQDIPTSEIERFTKDSMSGLLGKLLEVDYEAKATAKSLDEVAKIETTQNTSAVIDSIKDSVKDLGVVTTKTFKDMNNEVYKYIDTYKNLEKGINISDTYTKNDSGSFDFQGRVVNDNSVELTYKTLQKAHGEALKMNATYDDTIAKNHELANNSAWKQHFQDIGKSSKEIENLNSHYAELEKSSAKAMDTAHSEALKMNKTRDEEIAKIKESTIEQMKSQAASVQQRVATKGLSEEYGRQATMLRDQLGVIQARLQTEGKLSAEEVEQTNQLKEQLEILRAQTRTAISDDITENPSTFGQEFERRSSWFLSGAMFYGTINAAKQAVETIKDVEMGMVELSRVMNDSSFVFEDYRDNLLQLGVDYGQSFDNVQSIALRWAQSGYNVTDSLELTKTSLLALNTAELDATNATESMIGIMAQWNLQASDLALVMDKVNITADNYSVTSQDLVDGLLRSSGAAKIMGMSLDDTIATLTVLRETTGRTGQEVGNALSSILSYIQRPKSIDMLESLGIRMFADDAKTEFRNVMEVFGELSDKWQDPNMSKGAKDALMAGAQEAGLFAEELADAVGMQEEYIEMTEKATEAQGAFNDTEKRDAAQAAAGAYRRNYFIGLLERFSTTQEVLNGLVDAGGYSLDENAKSMETLEKKMESLKTSTEALAVAIGDAGLTDAFKMLVDGGTGALNAINKMPKDLKDLTLGALTTFTAVKTLQVGMKTFGIELPGISQTIEGLTNGTWNLVGALKAGKDGVIAFTKANALLITLSIAAGAVMAMVNAQRKHKEEQAKAIETSRENINVLDKQRQGLQELAREYDALKSKEQNLTANVDEKVRLKKIQEELVELYGVSVTGIDAEGQAYSDSAEAIENKIKLMEREKEIEESKLETAVKSEDVDRIKNLENNLKEMERIKQDTAEVKAEIERLENEIANRSNEVSFKSELGDMITWDSSTDAGLEGVTNHLSVLRFQLELLEVEEEKVSVAIQTGTQNIQNYLQTQAREIVQELANDGAIISDGTRLYIDAMAKSLSQAPISVYTLSDKLKAAIKDFTSADFDKWSEKYDEAMSKGDTRGIEKAREEISKLVRAFADGKPELNDFVVFMEESFSGKPQEVEQTTTAVFDLQTALGNMGATTKQTYNELKTLDKVISDVRNGQSLSVDTILDLNEKYGLNLDAVVQTTEGYTIEISTLEDLRETKIKTALDGAEAERQLAENVKNQVASRLTNYGLEIEQLKNLTNARAIMAGQASTVARQKANEATGGHSDSGIRNAIYKEAYDKHMAGADADLAAYEKALGDIEAVESRAKVLKGMLESGSSGSGKGSSKGGGGKSGGSSSQKEENKSLNESLKLLEHRKRISEESQDSIKAELAELKRINALYVKTADERMNMAERLYSTEKRLRDRTLQDSSNFISEKKNFNELSVADEIAAWERVKNNQVDNIEAVKQATLNLYKLRNQVMIDSFNAEENTIKHLTKLTVLSTEQQIVQYKKLYEVKAKDLSEQQKRTENLFNLQKQLMSEQQKKSKDIYDQRIEQIESETKARKDAQNDIIAGIEKELELLDRQEGEYDHDKKMADLREQLAYWEVRTSEDARKKVIDLKKQIDEAEHKREVDLQKEGLQDKKKVLEDGVTAIEDTAREERDKLDKSYKMIESAFDDHSLNVVAMAEVMSKGAYDEWLNNYIIPLQDALADGDLGKVDSVLGDMGGFIDSQKDFVGNYEGNINNVNPSNRPSTGSNNAEIYTIASTIAELKKQYALGNNPDAPSFTKPLYEQLSKLSPTVSDYLRNNDYIKAADYVKGLPKMHKGGKSLSYGAVYMKPGELTFPPDLSVGLERLFPLLSNLGKGNAITESTSSTDNRKSIKIENLLRIDNNHMEDDVDERSLSREIQRQLANMV